LRHHYNARMKEATARPALEVHGIGKTYFLRATPASRLWVPLMHRAAGWLRWVPPIARRLQAGALERLHRHQALADVSFTLERGEALGIIGLNGSGKSTLLQIVAGVLPPTEGTVAVNGRVAALLELGSGFNVELTGRENVRVNAAILGLTPAQIRDRMDDIIAFADIGGFIDEPVKAYSSGMAVRLAFAVQVHTDPDILIVDEALAVGDAAFQAKAMARIEQILGRGTTLLFVGHDLNALRAFCQRAILLESGRVTMQGLPEDVIEQYLFQIHARARDDARSVVRTAQGFGSDDGAILDARLGGGVTHFALRHGESVEVAIDLFADPGLEGACCVVDILDQRGLPLTGKRIRLPPRTGRGKLRVAVRFAAALQRGIYRVRLRLVLAPGLEHARVLSRYDSGLSFEVVDDCRERFTGLFPLPVEVDFPTTPGDG
jgi:lipopolysaccharide transport system ATP-binding protein